MSSRHKTIGLVIPCLNEASRLEANREVWRQSPFHLLFVDDGSTDNTAEWVRSQNQTHMDLLKLPKNGGKGEAVRQGMLHLSQAQYAGLEWIGFWDADLSTPLTEVDVFLRFQASLAPDAHALFGSRVYRLGSRIRRSYGRHVLGRLFSTAVGILFPELRVYDSQCGAKLFRRSLLEKAFAQPFASRWLFDLEILLRLDPRIVVECPVTAWEEKGKSKLNILLNAPRVLWDLLRMRITYPKY